MKKKIYAILIRSALALCFFAGCTTIGLPGRKTFGGKTAELIENWDGAPDQGEWTESVSSGTYEQSAGGMVDVRFSGIRGLRYTLPMGTGDDLTKILPEVASGISF